MPPMRSAADIAHENELAEWLDQQLLDLGSWLMREDPNMDTENIELNPMNDKKKRRKFLRFLKQYQHIDGMEEDVMAIRFALEFRRKILNKHDEMFEL